VQALLSLQGDPPPAHTPPPQTSLAVHGLLSLHGVVLNVKVHPVVGLQESFVQGLPSLHTTGGVWQPSNG
jgi:hypothetical protein